MPEKRKKFALLRHALKEETHFDLFLEGKDLCRTFRLSENIFKALRCGGEKIPPHRKFYLTHEGEVSGGRGTVTRISSGFYSILSEKEGLVVYSIAGERDMGTLLIRDLDEKGVEFEFSPSLAGEKPPQIIPPGFLS